MNDLTEYRKCREQMRTGDLLSYSTAGIVPWLIRKWSPEANHSGMVLDLEDYEGEDHRRWTLESKGNGPQLFFLSTALEQVHGAVWWHPLKPEFYPFRIAIGCFALEQVGVVKYDFESLVKNAFGLVSADLRKLFCSEYVFLSWKAGGIVTGDKAPRPAGLPGLGVTMPPVLIVQSDQHVKPPVDSGVQNPFF